MKEKSLSDIEQNLKLFESLSLKKAMAAVVDNGDGTCTIKRQKYGKQEAPQKEVSSDE